jgi:hypothetical protein
LLKGGTPLDASLEGSLGDSGGSGLADLEKQIRRLAEQGLTQGASKTAALEVVVAVAIAGVRAARRSLAKEGHGGADLCAGLDEGEGGPFFLPPFLGSRRRRRREGGPKKSSILTARWFRTSGAPGKDAHAELVQELEDRILEMEAELLSLRNAEDSSCCLEAELCGDLGASGAQAGQRGIGAPQRDLQRAEAALLAKEAELDDLRSSNRFFRGKVEELTREAESREAVLRAGARESEGDGAQACRILAMEAQLQELISRSGAS